MYLTASRPDTMFVVCQCARYHSTPRLSHLTAVHKIFRYLKGKPRFGLWYSRNSEFDLYAFSDSDYEGCDIDRKFTSTGCQVLGDRLISWQCKKQQTVSISIAEAEYVAAFACCSQVVWMQHQLLDYGLNFNNTPIFYDNDATIQICKNPVQHSKTKHIDMKVHFIRDYYDHKLIKMEQIDTKLNVANMFTKPVSISTFNVLVNLLKMIVFEDCGRKVIDVSLLGAVSNQNTQQALALPEKEVIQPHLPVRLPCYDFTPVTSPAFGIPLLAVKVTTSGMASSHSVTGGELQPAIRTEDGFLELAHPRGIATLCPGHCSTHAPPVSAFPKAPLSFKRIRGMSSPGGILNALATALHGSIRTAPSIHRLRLGLLGYLIPFAPLAFVSQCQCRPSRVLSPLVFFPISTHFTAPPEIPSAPTVLQLDALRPIIPDNACILCITAAAGTELADAYSPDTVIASSPGKEVHDPWAFYLHAALLRQAFAHCGKFPTAASRRSLGRVSVPVWLIILSDQLLIIALPFPAVVPLPRAGSYALLTRPPLETPLPVRLACVKHAASVHPEPGSNSP
ncbi:hypothetical protein E3N88_04274 [Mikania micrantha]|uniref:Reverse transcriptase Ty1/copia-type domain-containing protein n=2 Tax=Pentapetalae TaxID=1437201 RepID=A0A5N6PVU4_9ASTR|nr:hypothetical protein E3N88_04274 [Mikania micrantha]